MIKKTMIFFIIFTAFIGVFSAIYEYFGNGVYSNFMIFAFTIPLVFGILPCLICKIRGETIHCEYGMLLYDFTVITFTVAAVYKGVLDIYGTTNKYMIIYMIFGGMLFIASVLTVIFEKIKNKNRKS